MVQLPRPIPSPVKVRKRKVEEIADSDEEISSEYGWADDDELAAEGLVDETPLEDPEDDVVEIVEVRKVVNGVDEGVSTPSG